jgi:choline monooxygenase
MNLNLDSKYYYQPEYFTQERGDIFSTTWQLLGSASQLSKPGQYISEDISGMKVIAIRSKDNTLRAFKNVCRHRGAQLLDRGQGHCQSIRCPYHNWSYTDEGILKSAPWFGEDPDFNTDDWPLESIEIDQWRGLVFVSMKPEKSLLDQLGGLVSELDDVPIENYTCTSKEKLEFYGNWKIYTDNFVEGYHIPGIHPTFYDAIDFEKFETTASAGVVKMTAPAKKDLFYKGRWYWMWPNWTLSLFEGGINTSRINPISETRTELLYHFYFEDSSASSEEFRLDTQKRNIEVIREDFNICADTHNNYQSESYSSGPLSPRHEKGVGYFQNRYLDSMHQDSMHQD